MLVRSSIVAFVLLGVQAHAQDFVVELNARRAAAGIGMVYVDGGLQGLAIQNNQHQRARGLGHHIRHGFHEVAAVGNGNPLGDLAAWNNSGGHWAILMNPSLTTIGYATDGWASTAVLGPGLWYTPQVQQTAAVEVAPPAPVQLPAPAPSPSLQYQT